MSKKFLFCMVHLLYWCMLLIFLPLWMCYSFFMQNGTLSRWNFFFILKTASVFIFLYKWFNVIVAICLSSSFLTFSVATFLVLKVSQKRRETTRIVYEATYIQAKMKLLDNVTQRVIDTGVQHIKMNTGSRVHLHFIYLQRAHAAMLCITNETDVPANVYITQLAVRIWSKKKDDIHILLKRFTLYSKGNMMKKWGYQQHSFTRIRALINFLRNGTSKISMQQCWYRLSSSTTTYINTDIWSTQHMSVLKNKWPGSPNTDSQIESWRLP